jgi:hypothetical protein
VINKLNENHGSQKKSLRNTKEYIKRGRNNFRNTDLGLPVGYVTVKLIYITTRESKSTKLMEKQGMSDSVIFAAKIQISSSCLTLKSS